jgi:hypothetical protein
MSACTVVSCDPTINHVLYGMLCVDFCAAEMDLESLPELLFIFLVRSPPGYFKYGETSKKGGYIVSTK